MEAAAAGLASRDCIGAESPPGFTPRSRFTGAVNPFMSHVRERFRLWRLRHPERLGRLSSGEQDELRRLQDEHAHR